MKCLNFRITVATHRTVAALINRHQVLWHCPDPRDDRKGVSNFSANTATVTWIINLIGSRTIFTPSELTIYMLAVMMVTGSVSTARGAVLTASYLIST